MRLKTTLAAAVAVLAAAAVPAAAEPQITTIPGPSTEPIDIAVASDGRVWFSEDSSRLVRIEPDGSLTPFTSGFGEGQRAEHLTLGPDGNLWSSVNTNPGTTPSAIMRTTPSGDSVAFASSRYVGGITAGPDGNVWYAANDRVSWISPSGSGRGTAYTSGLPTLIAAGSDGNLWVATFDGSAGIERVTPDGDTTAFGNPAFAQRRIRAMTRGPDGAIWFTLVDANATSNPGRIGRIAPTGEITLFQDGVVGRPEDITAGADGNLWVSEQRLDLSGGRILRVTPSGQVTPYSEGLAGGIPRRIAAHPDGSLWFTINGTRRIGRIAEPPVQQPGPGDPDPGGPGGPVPGGPIPGGENPPVTDARPTSRITAPGSKLRQSRRTPPTARGTASDDKGVSRVQVSIVRRAGKRCESLTSAGKWKRHPAKRGKCEPRFTLTARGTSKWSLKLRRKLPKGTYTVASRATDSAGQREGAPRARSLRVLR